ncbi:helix-turn-helix domain-containing protein [Labrenzia sp. PHM005]|nr:helix-turn-helix domain-containing protein [Labrenzia sp. PHM005]
MTHLHKIDLPSEPQESVYPAVEMPEDNGSNHMSNRSSDYTLGERICKARDIAGLSTAQLARRLGIKTATMHSWESDRSEPRSNKLILLAGILNVSPTWLLVGRGSPPVAEDAAADIDSMRVALDRIQKQAQALADEISVLQSRLGGS